MKLTRSRFSRICASRMRENALRARHGSRRAPRRCAHGSGLCLRPASPALETGGIHEKLRLLAVEQPTVRKPLDQILQPLDVAGTQRRSSVRSHRRRCRARCFQPCCPGFPPPQPGCIAAPSSLLQLIRHEAHERMILRDPFLSGRVPPMTVLEDEPWRCSARRRVAP